MDRDKTSHEKFSTCPIGSYQLPAELTKISSVSQWLASTQLGSRQHYACDTLHTFFFLIQFLSR